MHRDGAGAQHSIVSGSPSLALPLVLELCPHPVLFCNLPLLLPPLHIPSPLPGALASSPLTTLFPAYLVPPPTLLQLLFLPPPSFLSIKNKSL